MPTGASVGYGLACDLDPGTCRRDHIASRLDGVEADGGDYEARCPVCHHGGFRVSRPTRSKRLRNVWTCACPKCRCPAGAIRAGLLQRDIAAACLGSYDGDNAKEIPPDVARAMDLAISDILATPGLKLQDVRIYLAEALDSSSFGLSPHKPGGRSLTPVVTQNREILSSPAGHRLAVLPKK